MLVGRLGVRPRNPRQYSGQHITTTTTNNNDNTNNDKDTSNNNDNKPAEAAEQNITHQNSQSQIPQENATEHPLDTSSGDPLEK